MNNKNVHILYNVIDICNKIDESNEYTYEGFSIII